ncbi:hypothetical protein NIES46_35370 [Arthrospira platensis NIES-46]|uniref:Uncharacterized protein n=1 Tax=Limnospira platensis NIES-46 TaxID=1236695 RepID=A0A5M3TA10_LIMPL|nr:hypothetical protein NIES46_35370 [Arthrospira platensis NIES-46]
MGDVNNAIASTHDSPSIQRLPETSDWGDVNNAIASHDLPSIQRLSETSDSSPIQRLSETSDSGDVNNAIASDDSPSIQRLSETSDSSPIQRPSETSDSGDVNDGISENDSSSIQREAELLSSISTRNITVKEMLLNGNIPEIQRFFKNKFITKNNEASNHQNFNKNNPKNSDFNEKNLVSHNPYNIHNINNQKNSRLNQFKNNQNTNVSFPQNPYIPDSLQVSSKGNILSSQFYNKPSNIKEIMQKTIQDRARLKQTISSQKSQQVESLREQDIYELEENIKAKATTDDDHNQPESKSEEEVVTSEQLEALAIEIYRFICQRFQVERERYGSHRSSGRFPW